jgi:uncharacterized protein YjiS (DUF1127 family)
MAMATMTHAVAGHTAANAHDGTSFVTRMIADFTAAWRRKRLRETLARMSDTELLDIGIAEEELQRVHAGEAFTPKAWAARDARRA